MSLLFRPGCAVAAVAVATAMALGTHALAQESGTLVMVDAVRVEPQSQTVPVLGRFVARQSGVVAARSGGPVAEVTVQVGDRVEAGQVLARLVKDTLTARQTLARADLTQAEQDLQRLENLRRSKSAAFQRARYEDAVQAVIRAKANLRLAEIDLRDAEILAPYPGVVTVRHTEAGSYLGVGQPVVTLINDEDLDIEADIPAERLAGLTPGRRITVEFASGEMPFAAEVRAVVPEENPMTRTRAVRFRPRYSNGTRGLAVNQSVTLHIPIGEPREVVSVHKDAIIQRQGRSVVFLVADGKAQMRPVRLGEAVGNRFAVVDGLEPGDVVVVRGNERLRPGQAVRTQRES